MTKYAPRLLIALAASTAALTFMASPALAQIEKISADSATTQVYEGRYQASGQNAEIQVSLRRDKIYVVEVLAAGMVDSDPYLTVVDSSGATLAEDDDGGAGLGSRAILTPESNQRVTLQIRPAGTDSQGSDARFIVTVRPADFELAEPVQLSLGVAVRGTVDTSASPSIFSISGTAGEELMISVDATAGSDLDPLVEIFKGGRASYFGEALAMDDDGGDDLDSLLTYTLPENGDYTIRVTGAAVGREGPFRILAEKAEPIVDIQFANPAGFGRDTIIELRGGARSGSVLVALDDATKARIRRGGSFISIALDAPEGDSESGVDPVLEVGLQTPLGFSTLERNDDAAGSLNSLITIDLGPLAEAGGDWLDSVRMKTDQLSGGAGTVILRVSPAE